MPNTCRPYLFFLTVPIRAIAADFAGEAGAQEGFHGVDERRHQSGGKTSHPKTQVPPAFKY